MTLPPAALPLLALAELAYADDYCRRCGLPLTAIETREHGDAMAASGGCESAAEREREQERP